MSKAPKFTNALIHAQSPYLLQHAHNPVQWVEWSEAAWEQAKREDKLVLVSVGYSACHWCHVMERECFEDEDTAAIMNEHFICIKVDREERPDIDQLYMEAVQLISGNGGWPLNVFCLSDGRPIHGGTYFPVKAWNQLLLQLHKLYVEKRETVLDYAKRLTEGIMQLDILKQQSSGLPNRENFQRILSQLKDRFDWQHGGRMGAPKFPMPTHYSFLMKTSVLLKDPKGLEMLRLTLDKMSLGGIYDKVEGGFSRYSVDDQWFAPHFEKMLYDNAQLISLYAEAAHILDDNHYEDLVQACVSFVEKEWKSKEGLYFSSYDADSEGEEGWYYTWTWRELSAVLGEDLALFAQYFHCKPEGNWEHNRNILHASEAISAFCEQQGLELDATQAMLQSALNKLEQAAAARIKPGLDDKCILSWNSLYLEALAIAAKELKNPQWLQKAVHLEVAIKGCFQSQGNYYRIVKNGNPSIPAFLEDLANLCAAYIALYQASFDSVYLVKAKELADLILSKYHDEESGFFFFNASDGPQLIARKKQIVDDVIPSPNSVMAINLLKLYFYFGESLYQEVANQMLQTMSSRFLEFPSAYSNWGNAFLLKEWGLYQLCVTGPGSTEKAQQLDVSGYVNLIVCASEKEEDLPILENRVSRDLQYFLCHNEQCYPPVSDWTEVERILEANGL